MLKKLKILILDILKKTKYKKIHNLFFFLVIIIFSNCNTRNYSFYIKAHSGEEVKKGAFEICGRDYKIIAFEEDTALVSCIKK
tara:strand:+ start:2666 stop:2914 length:249 start_codon:yes stop_codon:yes gene_type:complete